MSRSISKKAIATVLVSLAVLAGAANSSPVQALTLDQIKAQGTLRIGYQVDAKPFAFKDESGNPAGFTVTLCNAVADEIKAKIGTSDLPVEWVALTPDAAVQAIQQGQVDLICGSASETLASRAQVSFSIPIFPGGIGAVLSANGARSLGAALEGKPDNGPFWRASPARLLSKKIFAVVKGSTTEAWLNERIGHFQIDSTVMPVESYAAGLQAVGDGSANAFFGNRTVIIEAAGDALQSGALVALGRNFTSEPLAIALPLDSDGLRLVVDTALSREILSSEFADLYFKWFGPPDAATLQFYSFAALHP
jgi:ABC-type amino acid transport substrate-binding protein